MKEIPVIEKYMTPMPHTIASEMPLAKAYEFMTENRFRHLPVLHGGKLCGVLTDRDVKFASSFGNVDELKVEDVMSQDPFTVKVGAKLDEVVEQMAEKKIGSAIIQQDNGKVVGIFTAVDTARVLAEVLRLRFKK